MLDVARRAQPRHRERATLEKFYDIRPRCASRASTTPRAASGSSSSSTTSSSRPRSRRPSTSSASSTPRSRSSTSSSAPPTTCCASEFGQGLTDEGVHILDGFTGTGTFIVRLLQSGLIKPDDLARKYANELHANEILLLAYYIAAVNIETTYHDSIAAASATTPPTSRSPASSSPTPSSLRRTTTAIDLDVFPENNERLDRQKALDIPVIVGNPPYSVGPGQRQRRQRRTRSTRRSTQRSRTRTPPGRPRRTRTPSTTPTSARSGGRRPASRTDGVIAFVTNGGFLDSNTADGMRKTLAEEFTHIYVFNLRGNQRTAGEQSRREGGKVFGAGSRRTVAITVLVKHPRRRGTAADDPLPRHRRLPHPRAEARELVARPPRSVSRGQDHGPGREQRGRRGAAGRAGGGPGGAGPAAQRAVPGHPAADRGRPGHRPAAASSTWRPARPPAPSPPARPEWPRRHRPRPPPAARS